MNDTEGNFSSEVGKAHGDNWLKWLGHLKDTPAVGLELGTWKGESAEWMVENIFTHPRSRYFCVDTFEGSDEHRLAGIDCSGIEAEARTRLAKFENVTIHRNRSDRFLRDCFGRPDFIYVDAAHNAMDVLRDSVLAFDLLKPGGIFLWDDYEWKVYPDPVDCPKLAIDSFLACYARRLEVIGLGWQMCVRKIE
jgi:predicted O-methyltransferase YrrM